MMRVDVHHHFLPPAHVANEARRVKNAHATPQAQLAGWSPQRALDIRMKTESILQSPRSRHRAYGSGIQ